MREKISLILGLMLLAGAALGDFAGCSSDGLLEPRDTPIRHSLDPGSGPSH